MFIKDNRRINIYRPYGGYSKLTDPAVRASLGITEIPEPTTPEDYSEDAYYRTEQDTPPYVVYTKKSDEQIATIRKTKVQAKRDTLWHSGGCKVQTGVDETGPENPVPIYHWFHSDSHSKQQQMALAMLGENIPANLQWKTMDGTFVTMTADLAQVLFAAQITREAQIFAIAESKLNDDSAIEDGWPDVYVEPEANPDSV